MRYDGKVTAYIEGHGQYQTSYEGIDTTIMRYANDSLAQLKIYIRERQGNDWYEDLSTRFEALMILQELDGLATN